MKEETIYILTVWDEAKSRFTISEYEKDSLEQQLEFGNNEFITFESISGQKIYYKRDLVKAISFNEYVEALDEENK
ncbi:hypothetical protein [Lactococcus cremoris]|uniref:hypothetical protein n=1 Tax=Lactococcus lactis subsp. cremoris TaxID=1359 RepID=UPI002A1EFB0D|nr:hypothetical protein [Lactococcus lactis]